MRRVSDATVSARMPRLKDLRNRIASVKATQKITKAMQMVAAAKLRRAQEAAEAARPYAERMEKVLGQHRGLGRRRPSAPRAAWRHRRGPGASAGRLHRASAVCAAASTPPSCAWRASAPTRCSPTARRSRSSASAARATTAAPHSTRGRSSRRSICARVRADRLRQRRRRSPTRSWRCSRPASSTSARCSSRGSSR